MTETTVDGYLDGRLEIRQPRSGYRAGADPVILAAAVEAKPGERVLELGCGVGTALLCLGRRVAGLDLVGVERLTSLAELARENARTNGIRAEVVSGDVAALPDAVRRSAFDHVMMNPPYFPDGSNRPPSETSRAEGRHETLPLSIWIDSALKRLRTGGRMTLIQRTGRLPDILAAIGGRAGDVTLCPLSPREGREARLVILTATKGARGPFRLLPPLVLHDGRRHLADGDDHSEAARRILRDGQSLEQAILGLK